MAQDPAYLIYYKDILVSCADWDADVLGWYFRLLCHQADKQQGLPNDLEALAALAGVKFSQYDRFVSCWKHTLKAKFKANASGLLINEKQDELLSDRREYKEKQAKRGLIGSFIKKIRREKILNETQIVEITPLLFECISLSNTKEENEGFFKHTLNAYIGDVIGNGNIDPKKEGGTGEGNSPTGAEPQIIPPVIEMEKIWMEAKPEYPRVTNSPDDYTGLNAIGDFVAARMGLPWLPPYAAQRVRIMAEWKALANWIAGDEFYGTWALISLSSNKSMQTIWQKFKQPKNGNNTGTFRKNAGSGPVVQDVPAGGYGFNSRAHG